MTVWMRMERTSEDS